MGFFEDLNAMLNRGTEAAGRFADTANFKIKLTTLDARYKDLAAQLGESLYERVSQEPSLSAGLEQLLAEMASINVERSQIRAEIERIERAAEQAKASAVVYVCPSCGSSVQPSSRFCPSCGVQLGVPSGSQGVECPPVYTQVNAQAQPQQTGFAANPDVVASQTYEVPGVNTEER